MGDRGHVIVCQVCAGALSWCKQPVSRTLDIHAGANTAEVNSHYHSPCDAKGRHKKCYTNNIALGTVNSTELSDIKFNSSRTNLWDLKVQSVPRSKHFLPRL